MGRKQEQAVEETKAVFGPLRERIKGAVERLEGVLVSGLVFSSSSSSSSSSPPSFYNFSGHLCCGYFSYDVFGEDEEEEGKRREEVMWHGMA